MGSEYYIENDHATSEDYDFKREKALFYKSVSPLLWSLRCFGVYEPEISDEGPPKKSGFYVWAIILRSYLTGLISLSILNLILSEDGKIEKLYSSFQILLPWVMINNNLNNLERLKLIWRNIPETTRLLKTSVEKTNYYIIVVITGVYALLQSK